jgi:hypothetical protein
VGGGGQETEEEETEEEETEEEETEGGNGGGGNGGGFIDTHNHNPHSFRSTS